MRFNEPRNRNQKRLPISVVISVLLHALVILIFAGLANFDDDPSFANKAPKSLSVRVVSQSVVKKEKKKEKEPEFKEKMQIVSAPKPQKEETPEKAEFADRYESKVEKQSVKRGEKGSPVISKQKSKSPKALLPKLSKGAEEKENQVREQKSVQKFEEAEEAKADRPDKEGSLVEKEEGKKGGKNDLDTKSLFPQLSDAALLNPNGIGGSNDYLKNVDEGSKTLLNRKRTRYWAFFDRIKTQIGKEWSPNKEYRSRDPFGDIYGVKDRYSVINVTLNSDGSVRRLYIDKKSGADFLDDEALRAVRQASPFYNPPEGLKDEDGNIHFKFGFYLEIGTGRMRLFKTGR